MNYILTLFLILSACIHCSGSDLEVGGHVYDSINRACPERKVALLAQDTSNSIAHLSIEQNNDGEAGKHEWVQSTDDIGHFLFSGLKRGEYVLIILDDLEHGGKYDSVNYTPVMIELTNSVTNLRITPSVIDYVEISGHILSVHSGEPIMAEIEFSPEHIDKMPSSASWMIDFSKSVSTDESGAFVKARVPMGLYYMTIFNMDEAKYKRSRVTIKIAVQRLNEPLISEQYREYLDAIGLAVDVHMAAPGGHAILIDGSQNEE